MKKIIILLAALLLIVMAGCTDKPEVNTEEEHVHVTFIGSCTEKTIELIKGNPLGNPDQYEIVYSELNSNETLEAINFYYENSFEPVDFEAPVNEDTVVIVEITVSASAVPVENDNNSSYVDVTDIDVPNCRYEENGTRYKAELKPGSTFKMNAVVFPDNATNKNIIYSIDSDNGVVSLDNTGLIKANKYGSTMVRATSEASGVNVGILVLVEGYEINVEIPNQKDVYSARDVIGYETMIKRHRNIHTEELYELPEGTSLEILSGEDVLTFDNSTGELKVSGNPSKTQEVTFRFAVAEKTGTDYSNELTVTVGKLGN